MKSAGVDRHHGKYTSKLEYYFESSILPLADGKFDLFLTECEDGSVLNGPSECAM